MTKSSLYPPFVLILTTLITLAAEKHLPAYWRDVFFGDFNFPFTFQGAMWFPFIWGVFLVSRSQHNISLSESLSENINIPGNELSILDSSQIAQIISHLRTFVGKKHAILQNIAFQVIVKYQSSRSVDQATAYLTASLEIQRNKMDTGHNLVRFLCWFAPTLGFMGTVYGISLAVSTMGKASPDDPALFAQLAGELGIAFNTTLLALAQSAFLIFFQNVIQSREENFVNDSGQLLLTRLINKLE